MAKVDAHLTLDFTDHDDIAADVAIELLTHALNTIREDYSGERFNVESFSVTKEEDLPF